MKVILNTILAGPNGCFGVGEVVDLPDAFANELLRTRAAEPIGAPRSIAEAAARDMPIYEKRDIKIKPVKTKAKE